MYIIPASDLFSLKKKLLFFFRRVRRRLFSVHSAGVVGMLGVSLTVTISRKHRWMYLKSQASMVYYQLTDCPFYHALRKSFQERFYKLDLSIYKYYFEVSYLYRWTAIYWKNVFTSHAPIPVFEETSNFLKL